MLCRRLILDHSDHIGNNMAYIRCWQTEIHPGQGARQVDGITRPRRVAVRMCLQAQHAGFSHNSALGDNRINAECVQLADDEDIRPASRCNLAYLLAHPKMLGGIDGCHL